MASSVKGRKAEPVPAKLRVVTINVGTLSKRANEVAETLSRRRADFACLQETRYKGKSNRWITGKCSRFKLFWHGNENSTGGVGIMVLEKWVEQIIAVDKVSSRIVALKVLIGKRTMTVISAYAPQQGLSTEEKSAFYADLTCLTSKLDDKDIVILGGDLNGHVGQTSSGYEKAHGGFGYGSRNAEGHRILEFCSSQEMLICNTHFQKRDSQLITYSSGGNSTQIDYILLKSKHRNLVKDTKVIPKELNFRQHKLVVCDLRVRVDLLGTKKKKPFTPKLRVWKLKDPVVSEAFSQEVASHLKPVGSVEGVEETWSDLKSALITASENCCGWTKCRPKQRVTWWWNDQVDAAISAKRESWQLLNKGLCSEHEYATAKKAANRAVYDAKRLAEAEEFGNLSTSAGSRDNAFKIAKQMKAANQDIIGDPCVKNDKGNLAFSDAEKLMAWKEHYMRLLNEEFEWDESLLVWSDPVEGTSVAPHIPEHVICKALAKMKVGKAAGSSGVVAEMLKASGAAGISYITHLFNLIIRERKIPSDWDKSVILNLFKGKGDATDRGNYRGLKLLEHSMKLFEQVIEQYVRNVVNIDGMQFGFMPGKGTMEAIFIIRQIQEKALFKCKTLYLTFVDLEKAFDRVPRKVVKWALRKVRVDEWLIEVIMAMYSHCRSAVSVNGITGDAFDVMVGVHQGSVLSPLLFIIVMEALSRDFRAGLPWELLYADDLALIAESLEDLERQYTAWQRGMENKGLRVNTRKTKVMISSREHKPLNKTGKHPCGVCLKGVGSNSILCPECKHWIHNRCSQVIGSLSNAVDFVCPSCRDGSLQDQASQPPPAVTLAGANLEVVNKFCYLGDMLDAGGGAESSSITRVNCGWSKFRDLLPLLGSRAVSLSVKGSLYRACVQTVMLYGSETWPVRIADSQRLDRTEMSMIRWMCGASLSSNSSSAELRALLGVTPITVRMSCNRLRWYGHVSRKDVGDWLRKVQEPDAVIAGVALPGRPLKSWKEVIDRDLDEHQLDEELVHNRDAWRAAIDSRTV